MRIAILLVPGLAAGCFYGSEFIPGDELAKAATECGVTAFRITHEDDADYLNLPIGTNDPDAIEKCVEQKSEVGSMALVRVDGGEGEFTQAEADAITKKCGAPARWLKVENGQLAMWLDADADYEVSACVARAVAATGKTKFGFVGNEKIAEPEDQ